MKKDIMDVEEFLDRVEDDKALLLELLDIFVEDFQKKRKNLQEAFEQKDFEQIENIGHYLRGSTANISAKTLLASCTQCEGMGQDKDLAQAPEVLASIDKNFAELTNFIENLKKEMKA